MCIFLLDKQPSFPFSSENVVYLVRVPTKLISEQVNGRFPEVSIADHEVICITELQHSDSLLIVGTGFVATMHAIEATRILPKMSIESSATK